MKYWESRIVRQAGVQSAMCDVHAPYFFILKYYRCLLNHKRWSRATKRKNMAFFMLIRNLSKDFIWYVLSVDILQLLVGQGNFSSTVTRLRKYFDCCTLPDRFWRIIWKGAGCLDLLIFDLFAVFSFIMFCSWSSSVANTIRSVYITVLINLPPILRFPNASSLYLAKHSPYALNKDSIPIWLLFLLLLTLCLLIPVVLQHSVHAQIEKVDPLGRSRSHFCF